MISPDGKYEHCEKRACPNKIRNHRWAKTRAVGWFFTKDNRAYCPDHIPSWVAAWREKYGVNRGA